MSSERHSQYTCRGTLEDFALNDQIKGYTFLCVNEVMAAFADNFVFGKLGYGLDTKASEAFSLQKRFLVIYMLVREMDIPQDIVGCIMKTLLF